MKCRCRKKAFEWISSKSDGFWTILLKVLHLDTFSKITDVALMRRSIRNLNIPPRAYPRHLTVHRAQGGGNLNVALKGWGIWTGFISFWRNTPVNFFGLYRVWRIHKIEFRSSSETQGQLVGATGFSWAKVYNKSGRAPGHLLLPNEFQKRLKSRLLIGQKNIFLANQRRGTAGRLSCLLTRGCFPHRTP